MKARKGPPKDYEEIRAKVAEASKLMAGGLSESKAAKSVGLPRSSLQQYIQHGVPNLGLPKVPKSTLPRVKNCQEDLAGVNRDAAKPACQEISAVATGCFWEISAGKFGSFFSR